MAQQVCLGITEGKAQVQSQKTAVPALEPGLRGERLIADHKPISADNADLRAGMYQAWRAMGGEKGLIRFFLSPAGQKWLQTDHSWNPQAIAARSQSLYDEWRQRGGEQSMLRYFSCFGWH